MNRAERVGRGVVATSVAVFFAAVSHVIAGAAAPHVSALLLTIIVVLPLSIALAGRRLSLTRLFALVLASQALFHASFSLIGAHSGLSAQATSTALPSHASHAHTSGILSDAVVLTTAGSSAIMLVLHAAAAIVTVTLLRLGERAFVTLVTFVASALAALRGQLIVVQHTIWDLPIVLRGHHLQPISSRVLVTTPRRGPPSFSA